MSGYVIVADHPYYALSGPDGKYALTDVPPGSYRLKMWHEGVIVSRTELEHGIPKKYYFEEPYEVTQDVAVPAHGKVTMDFDLVLR
jgi:hypothetical protein